MNKQSNQHHPLVDVYKEYLRQGRMEKLAKVIVKYAAPVNLNQPDKPLPGVLEGNRDNFMFPRNKPFNSTDFEEGLKAVSSPIGGAPNTTDRPLAATIKPTPDYNGQTPEGPVAPVATTPAVPAPVSWNNESGQTVNPLSLNKKIEAPRGSFNASPTAVDDVTEAQPGDDDPILDRGAPIDVKEPSTWDSVVDWLGKPGLGGYGSRGLQIGAGAGGLLAAYLLWRAMNRRRRYEED